MLIVQSDVMAGIHNYIWKEERDQNPKKTKPLTAILDGYRPQTREYAFPLNDVINNSNFSMLFVLEPVEPAAKPPQQQQQQMMGTTVIIPGERGVTKNFGSLNIITTPAQAEIYIDGFFVATTPATNLQLESGQHKIEIQKAGYKTWTRSLQALPNSPVTIEITLEKQGLPGIYLT